MAAALPIALVVSAALGAGASIYSASHSPGSPKAQKPPDVPELPQLPQPLGQIDDERRRRGRSSTLLTRPSALSDPSTFKPTLLGQ